MVVKNPISKKGIETLVGRPISDYASVERIEGHEWMSPESLLTRLAGKDIPKKVRDILRSTSNVCGEATNSGEVWMGAYHIAYLYLGKTKGGEDVSLCLGGDTFESGILYHSSDKNLVKNPAKGFYEKLFP